jgi:hypothetical protein
MSQNAFVLGRRELRPGSSLLFALSAAGCLADPVIATTDDPNTAGSSAGAETTTAGPVTTSTASPTTGAPNTTTEPSTTTSDTSGGSDPIDPTAPIHTLDLRSLASKSPATKAERGALYDTLVAATCMQGLANRDAPNVYLFFANTGEPYNIDLDQLWLDRIHDDPTIGRGALGTRPIVALDDVDALIETYAPLVQGLVVWDENVPATINAAFAAAGAEDLLAVRWDASADSLYARLRAKGLVVKEWLVNEDGSPMFTDGASIVPGTVRKSSGYAKDDVYLWVAENLQKTQKLDPTEFGSMLDAVWVKDPNDYKAEPMAAKSLLITNRDLLVAKRGLPFDLSPWKDVGATDVPGQKAGTDPAIVEELLLRARAQASADDAIIVRGFVPWEVKYTSEEGLPLDHDPVHTEWIQAKLFSPFAAGMDADGLATMANASFYRHVPIDEAPVPQTRPTPEDLIGNGYLAGLAPNGGFEDGSAGWVFNTKNHVVYTDDLASGARAHSGLRSLQWNSDSALANDIYRDGPGVAVGETVTARAYVRSKTPIKGKLVVWGLGGTKESAIQEFTAGTQWSEVRVKLTMANGGHTSTRCQFYLDPTGVNLDVDDVAFYKGDAAAATVEPANYLVWYVGDYDSSAWMYGRTPYTWDTPGRGIIPLAWSFSADARDRFPVIYNYLLETRTARDFFINADSGPAYGNPGWMDAPARKTWRHAGMRGARHLDTASGWLLDAQSPLDAAHIEAVTPFYGDGIMMSAYNAPTVQNGDLVDNVPIQRLGTLKPGKELEGSIVANGKENPLTPTFTPYRTTQSTFRSLAGDDSHNTEYLVTISNSIVTKNPSYRFRIVDPFTFFALMRRQGGGSNKYRASYLDVDFDAPKVGQDIPITIHLRNDGWETWVADGPNNYRVGFDVSTERRQARESTAYTVHAPLDADVPPGGTTTVMVDLPAIPDAQARYLQVDVVHEGVTWFEGKGDVPLQITLHASN